MNTSSNKNQNLEIDALASLVADFFETRIGGEEGKSLAKLTRVLTERVASGSSHLLPAEVNEVLDGWKSLPAIGNEDAGLPLVCTDTGRLYFRRYYEYERLVADVLSHKCTKASVEVSNDTEEFFKNSISHFVDDQQALAVGAVLQRDLVLLWLAGQARVRPEPLSPCWPLIYMNTRITLSHWQHLRVRQLFGCENRCFNL